MAKRVKVSDFTVCDVCGIDVKKVKLQLHKLKCHMDDMVKKSDENVFEVPDGIDTDETVEDFSVDDFLSSGVDDDG